MAESELRHRPAAPRDCLVRPALAQFPETAAALGQLEALLFRTQFFPYPMAGEVCPAAANARAVRSRPSMINSAARQNS